MKLWVSIAHLIALAASLASAEDAHALAHEGAVLIDDLHPIARENAAGLVEKYDRVWRL